MTVFNPERFVCELLLKGVSEGDIKTELQEKHRFSSNVSRMLIERTKANNPEIAEWCQQQRQAIRQQERKSSPITLIIGICLLALGAGVTACSFTTAEPGGAYLVTSGLIGIGLLTILKGVWHLIRWW